MFYIHQSNQMELLAHQLSNLFGASLDNNSAANPFIQEKVLVQSPGMSQWLKIYLAQQLGVMANIDFPLPSSFIWSLYKELITDLPDQSAFNKGEMAWKLYTILPNHLDDESFLPLKNYLTHDKNGLMLFQLSEKIADVFDQYLMYRPDWIESWEANDDDIKDGDTTLHPWQPILWRALKEHTADLQQSEYHRANLHDVLLEQLAGAFADKTHKIHADLPQRLFIFGISALPSQQLHVFEQLSEHVDIHLMLFNPCAHYWGDIVDQKQLAKVQARFANKKHLGVNDQNYMTVGNPLLASWGKLGRDYLEQLLEINADQYDYFVEPEPSSMLCRIQADVFNLSFRDQIESLTPAESLTAAGKQSIDVNDNSLMFHACHSPLREVEVLYDQLLHLFEQGSSPSPTLTPKDIIVMMPDVSLYSPYIDAVFAGSEVNRIPYAISDKGFVLENPILNSFLQLMKLPDSRFSASELLDLISVPATTLVMGLVEEDIDLIRNWINEVGIRWGIDSDHKQSLDLPNDELNSWRFGLNRLLMGYAIGNETLVDGILPYKHVEGQNAETLGKLVFFIDTLIGFRAQLNEVATISDKIATVNDLVVAFYQTDKNEEQAINTIRQVLIEFETHFDTKNCEQPISQKVFAYYINNAFNDKGVGQRFLAGQVNFCTLMPMRSIPFKVICLLGMNDADYPRFVAPVGFDLMATGKTRKGDRSRRLDDRYLLLEAMLSARDKLYVSYVGHSMQDNSEKIPSVLVTELLEYCEQAFTFGESQKSLTNKLVQFHPLQPFNPAYFSASSSSLKSYQPHWYRYVNQQNATIDSQISEQPIDDTDVIKTLDLEQLIRFMLHPVKYFFNHTLQLYFSSLTQVEQDDETFMLDALTRYQLLESLSASKLAQSGLGSYSHINGTGNLPHREVGKLTFDKLDNQADGFLAALNETSLTPLTPVEVNLNLKIGDGNIQLLGWVKNLTTNGLLFYRPAKVTAKDRLVAWMHHVVMAAIGRPVVTRHIGLSESVDYKRLSQKQAKALLQQWVELYLDGRKQPLPFFVKSSEKWCQTAKMTEVAKMFNGSSFNQIPGEGDDLYIERVFKDVDNLPKAFEQLAEQIFKPLFDAVEE
jgi:exodeoxyribonuclease V gamma subunit